MKIEYAKTSDYFLPMLKLSEEINDPPLGRYGTLHKNYLKKQKPILYNRLLLQEKLYPLCREIDKAAEIRRKLGCSEKIILSELVYD